MAKKVLVTGSCGFMGPYIIEELLKKGYEVRATDLPGADYRRIEPLSCEIAHADLLKKDQAKEVFKDINYVIHTAARMNYYMERWEYELANYQVTVSTCEAALEAGVKKFVHFSTCDTYGPPRKVPVDESYPQKPINLYSITKLYGELAALKFHKEKGLPVTVIRPTTIYGPRCVYVMGIFLGLPVMLKEMGIDFFYTPNGGILANLVHAEDVAGASVFLMEKKESVGEAYNISDDSAVPAGKLMEILLNSVGIETKPLYPLPKPLVALVATLGSFLPKVFFTTVTEYLQKAWDRIVIEHKLLPMLKPRFDPGFTAFGRGDYYFDNSKIKKLGYELRHPDLRKGWMESARWFMEEGWIPTYEQVGAPGD